MKIESQFPLLEFNTLAIKANAQYAATVKTPSELEQCLEFARSKQLEVKVLGGGSNVVMADYIPGLVLMYGDQTCELLSESDSQVTIKVGAGYNWHEFVMFCLLQGWYGLENLVYIPGSVGAAPVQNIGAYGVEVKDLISSVRGVYLDSGKSFELTSAQCEFSYRESCFKQGLNGKTIITSVTFTLSKLASVSVGYAPLDKLAQQHGTPSPLELASWITELRQSKLPNPSELPNAGSFFKNPVVSQVDFKRLIGRFPQMPNYPQGKNVKLAAGWLIDQMGFKGRSFGLVGVHEKQALVIVNKGGSGAQVLDAAKQIKLAVKECYGIELEQEPRVFE